MGEGLRAKKLTRRGLLLPVLAGAAELTFLWGKGKPVPRFTPVSVAPSQVLDLASWKLNLPTGNQQVAQPQLSGFYDDAFRVIEAVQFTAMCGGDPQPGSEYPRSELREMNPDGSSASWSSTSGTHTMELTQRITHLPVVKPQLICGQIHGESTYLILAEINSHKLYVRYKDEVAGVLDEEYQPGTFFDLKIRAAGGYVDVFYNGTHMVRQAMSESACYFKAGCYVQSSTGTGDLPTAYGQVEISRLAISHT